MNEFQTHFVKFTGKKAFDLAAFTKYRDIFRRIFHERFGGQRCIRRRKTVELNARTGGESELALRMKDGIRRQVSSRALNGYGAFMLFEESFISAPVGSKLSFAIFVFCSASFILSSSHQYVIFV